MGTSSEDVLLMVQHVRLKKNDGVLYLMNERLGWMTGSKDSFSVTHKYADIKSKGLHVLQCYSADVLTVCLSHSSENITRRQVKSPAAGLPA